MKKIVSIITFSFILIACSSDSEEVEKVEPKNLPPSVPTLSLPEDNLFCTANELDFKWAPSVDPEGDNLVYVFQLSKTNSFSELYHTAELSSLLLNKTLVKGQNFYWRVKAKDVKGNQSNFSEVRSFYTEDEQDINSLPSVPRLIKPESDFISGSIAELEWEATDPDGEELKYDLYFGNSESPALLKEDLLETSYTVNNLTSGKKYYWKIVVTDKRGGKTIGQTWSFTMN